MPSPKSQYYSLSFHPELKEFYECKSVFLDNFKKFVKKAQAILVLEKGSKDEYTHYQGFLEFDKEKRADSLKKSAFNMLLKGIEVNYPKVALKLTSVTRDVKYCQGYCLKETNDELQGVAYSSYPRAYQKEAKRYHAMQLKEKKVKGDKFRVSTRNLPQVFKTYCEVNGIEITNNSKCIPIIIGRMANDDYCMMSIVTKSKKQFFDMCEYLFAYMKNDMEKYCFQQWYEGAPDSTILAPELRKVSKIKLIDLLDK